MASKWEGIFRFDTVAAGRRWSFNVEGRGSIVSDAGTGDLSLEFYRRTDSKALETLACRELVAYPPPGPDESLKVWTALLVAMIYVIPAILVSGRTWADWPRSVDLYFLVACALFSSLVFIVLVARLRVHFIDMNTRWQNAITHFYDPDMKMKMLSIRDCMLEYQSFIKWRRTMGYILVVLGSYFFVQFGLMAVAAQQSGAGFGAIDSHNLAVAALFLSFQIFVTGYYAALRSFWTSRREPTLQLCVMIAEENRNTVNAQRSGIIR